MIFICLFPWIRAYFKNIRGKTRFLKTSISSPSSVLWVAVVFSVGTLKVRSAANTSKTAFEAATTAKIAPRRKIKLSNIYLSFSSLILPSSNLWQIFFLPIFSLAEYVDLHISHLGISTTSALSIFFVIQSKMQSSCTYAMLPEHSQSVMRGLVSS